MTERPHPITNSEGATAPASPPLPLGVVIPTFNCAAHIPAHLDALRGWIDLAREIVVVDSESTDGTVEQLRSGLGHLNVRFFTRPRGLYQAWNFGIAQLTSKFTYVSTAGDTITRDGIIHLLETAQQLGSDVLMSPPELIPEEGVKPPADDWPIHRIIAELKIAAPVVLRRGRVLHFAIDYALDVLGILGSSASNLYRTTALQTRPFPADCGHAGDVFWGVRHALDARFAITPRRCSTFLVHPVMHTEQQKQFYLQLQSRLPQWAGDALRAAFSGGAPADAPELELVREYLGAVTAFIAEKDRVHKLRDQHRLWSLYPSVWRARGTRNRHRRHAEALAARLREIPAVAANPDL